jgi:hypothetical protein
MSGLTRSTSNSGESQVSPDGWHKKRMHLQISHSIVSCVACERYENTPRRAGGSIPASTYYLEWIGKRDSMLVDREFMAEHFSSSDEYHTLVKEYVITRSLPSSPAGVILFLEVMYVFSNCDWR